DGARPRRQHPLRPRGSPVSAERRDGEEQRRAHRGRRPDVPRRRSPPRDGGRSAEDPGPRDAVVIERAYAMIRVSVAGQVPALPLHNPARKNAIGPAMVNELLYALEDAASDDAVRAIVITGSGDAFCAGGDFAQMTGGATEAALPPKGDYADLLLAMT